MKHEDLKPIILWNFEFEKKILLLALSILIYQYHLVQATSPHPFKATQPILITKKITDEENSTYSYSAKFYRRQFAQPVIYC